MGYEIVYEKGLTIGDIGSTYERTYYDPRLSMEQRHLLVNVGSGNDEIPVTFTDGFIFRQGFVPEFECSGFLESLKSEWPYSWSIMKSEIDGEEFQVEYDEEKAIHILVTQCPVEENHKIAEWIYKKSEIQGFFNMYLIGPSKEDRGVLSRVWAPPLLPFGQEVGSLVLPSMDFERIYMNSKWLDDNSVVEMIASVREEGFKDKIPVDKKESLNSEFCMNCHQDSYDVWKDSRHAHAWETLVDRDVTLRPDCVGCHVTNWSHEDLSYSYVNVGCVACHQGDPIQHSIKPSKNTLVASFDTCYSCHRPDHSTLFSVKGYWPQIEHP